MARLFVLHVVVSVVAGCSPGVSLETDRGSYRAGSPLSLKLSTSEPRIAYNFCDAVTELRLPEGTWQESYVLAPPSSPTPGVVQVCDAALHALIGPDAVSRAHNLSVTAQAGVYRFRLRIERAEDTTEVTSNSFEIVSPPPAAP